MDALLSSGHALCEAVAQRTCASLRSGNKLRLLPHANLFFPELFRGIEGAERSIEIELYRVHPGRLATEVVQQLLAAARRGVRVSMVLDGVGSRAIRDDELNRWRNGGINVGIYNPLALAAIRRLGTRNHRKLVILDGATAFTGGMSIDDNFSHHSSSPWRETMIRADGPVVADMQSAYAASAATSTPAADMSPICVAHRLQGRSDAQYILASPTNRNAVRMYVEALARAERTTYITTPYFIPPPDVMNALVAAATRGVEVQILTAGAKNDVRVARVVSRYAYERCLNAGIRIFEYQPSMLHSKCMVVDGVWSTVGSSNWDYRSLCRSFEANLATCDRAIALAVQRLFIEDAVESREITVEDWRRRSLREKVYATAAWPLRTLL